MLNGQTLKSATSDYDQRHVIAFRPISAAARSWSYDNNACISIHSFDTVGLACKKPTLNVQKVLLADPSQLIVTLEKKASYTKTNWRGSLLQKLEQNLPRSVLSMMVAEQSASGVPPSQQVARDDQLSRTDSKFVDEVCTMWIVNYSRWTCLLLKF